MKALQEIRGFHLRAISALAFSSDGELLASAGQDAHHTIAIWQWKTGTRLYTARGGIGKVLALAFGPNDSPGDRTLVQCSAGQINFWSVNKNMKATKALLGKRGLLQPFYCVAFNDGSPVVGCNDGHLYTFKGRALLHAIKAHDGAVTAICWKDDTICTGGKDGKVKLWNKELDNTQEFDVTSIGSSLKSAISSVCISPDGKRIAVGTEGSEIYELDATTGKCINEDALPLIQGHYEKELWGMAVNPVTLEFCTVGDDKTLRIWDVQTRKIVRRDHLSSSARACAYSPDGKFIAVGLGAGKAGGGKKDGAYCVYQESDLKLVHEGRDTQQYVRNMKFTPDGTSLGLASQDGRIFLYDVNKNYQKRATFVKHNIYVTNFDFSADSQHMQSNCGNFDLLFADVTTGAQIPTANALKDQTWYSASCPLAWPTTGLWAEAPKEVQNVTDHTKDKKEKAKKGEDKADNKKAVKNKVDDQMYINSVHRSNIGTLIASGDNFGRLRLHKYPAVEENTAHNEYRGHSTNVSNVRFTWMDTHLITVGANDRCIFQWKHNTLDDSEGGDMVVQDDDPDLEADSNGSTPILDPEVIIGLDEEKGNEPWVGNSIAPSNPPEGIISAPDVKLVLEHVYGYRAQDVRSSLVYNANDELVYFTARVGIVYDSAIHRQHFYTGHSQDITCLALSNDRHFVATGEKQQYADEHAQIHLWDACTGMLICKLPKFHTVGIRHICFSKDGNFIASVGMDEDNSIAVWKRRQNNSWALQCHGKAQKEKALFVVFTESDEYQLMTGGIKHATFWRMKGHTLNRAPGLFGKMGKLQTIICGCPVRANSEKGKVPTGVITGTQDGHLYRWEGRTLIRSILAHDKSINSVFATHLGIVSGGSDGFVKLWNYDLSKIEEYNMRDAQRPSPPDVCVKSVCWNTRSSKILVGTRSSEIYEISLNTKTFLLLSEAHCYGQTSGLHPHPSNPDLFVTGGDDCTVRVWNAETKSLVQKAAIDSMTRSVAWSADGKFIAVGLGGKGTLGSGQKKDGAVCFVFYCN
jgi:microtubule-associated protein-like 6